MARDGFRLNFSSRAVLEICVFVVGRGELSWGTDVVLYLDRRTVRGEIWGDAPRIDR